MTESSQAVALQRLSVPKVARVPRRDFTDAERSTLIRVAQVLIPPRPGVPGCHELADFDERIAAATAILDPHFETIVECLAELSAATGDSLKPELVNRHETGDTGFYWVSMLLSGAYVYSENVAKRLNYPRPHRNPPNIIESVEALVSGGLLDPVLERGPLRCAAVHE